MKKPILMSLLLGLASTPIYAGQYQDGFHDKARVVSVMPIMERVEVPVDRESCWQEDVETTTQSDAGMVLGGIIGGVIGHQIGHGHQRGAATVAGGVIGAAIGADSDRRNASTTYETRDRCRVRTEYVQQERLRAYEVTYRYQGQTFTTEMDHEPGRFIPVRVQVTPLD